MKWTASASWPLSPVQPALRRKQKNESKKTAHAAVGYFFRLKWEIVTSAVRARSNPANAIPVTRTTAARSGDPGVRARRPDGGQRRQQPLQHTLLYRPVIPAARGNCQRQARTGAPTSKSTADEAANRKGIERCVRCTVTVGLALITAIVPWRAQAAMRALVRQCRHRNANPRGRHENPSTATAAAAVASPLRTCR
jgi:hypothetical protein